MSIASSSVLPNYTAFNAALAGTHSPRQAGTLIAVSGRPDASTRQAIVRDLQTRPGIVSAHFIREQPAMLLVEYFPGQERATGILKQINRASVTARRIC